MIVATVNMSYLLDGFANVGHFAYGTLRLLVISPTRHFAYWTVRLLDSSPTGLLDISPTTWAVRLHIALHFTNKTTRVK